MRRSTERPVGKVDGTDDHLSARHSKHCDGQENATRRPVSRVLSSARGRLCSHSSGSPVARTLTRHTRGAGWKRPMRTPYSVLLQAGFTMPGLLPAPRWALTPPFHPYSGQGPKRSALCGTFPRLAPGGHYPPPCLHGARTFLQQQVTPLPATARPSGQAGHITPRSAHCQRGLTPSAEPEA